MFDFTPKSNLIQLLVNYTKNQPVPNDPNGHSPQKNSKFLSFGSFRKKKSRFSDSDAQYNDVLDELTESKNFFTRPKYTKTGPKNNIRASWHGETKNSRRTKPNAPKTKDVLKEDLETNIIWGRISYKTEQF